ncbi:PDZ domain containing 3b isoform X1 [Pygocentrus nattereri]|uniref:PDZ domain containing 3b isoform X1 n=2 Tax=Pygocentrus nattereri TaxID=42514 RepID=UPI000814AE63|nr:PDZ domain containing 3b isoform X1 [Pygocentrus nattereri]
MRVTYFPVLEYAMELTDRFVFNLKEGIDNPAMDIAEDAERVSDPLPRVCVLKREEGENFGFHLRVERGLPGHVVRHVETFGVAEKAGLRNGDRLLEVNELFVDDLEHGEVAHKIQVSGPQLCLLVLDGEEYEQAVAQGRDLKELASAQRGEGWKPPRLCHITRDPGTGLGFSILPVEGEKGKFTISPVTGGPAEKAGVRKGDRLIWINGAMACELTHSAISKMVKKCSDHMTVLVIDSESEKCYVRRRMLILPAMANAQSMPYRPRRLHLEQGPDGYGFYLRQEKTSAGRLVHMLRDVEAGSPAELAGVKDGELLLEVNGVSTECLSHEDVVSLFRQSGQQVTITTMALHGQDFYTKLGLSPLLFTEEHSPAKEQKEKLASLEQSAAVVMLVASPAEAQEELWVEPNIRLCVVQRGTVGFGFHLGCIQQKPGTFINQVTARGPAESSGLLQGDVIVEVNGQNVEDECLEDVILLMKKGETTLSLLVVDRPGYECLKKNGKPITAEKVVKASEVKDDVSPSPIQPTL